MIVKRSLGAPDTTEQRVTPPRGRPSRDRGGAPTLCALIGSDFMALTLSSTNLSVTEGGTLALTVSSLDVLTRPIKPVWWVVVDGSGDPVASGVVTSLSRPGGNVTGLVLQEFESTVKWLELVKQVLPRA